MIYTIIGTIGAVLVLFGFYRTTIGKWTGKSVLYELDNLVGSILVAIYQFHHHVYITVTLNVIWAIVALRGLNSYRQRKAKKRR